jgi:hypothetical protein
MAIVELSQSLDSVQACVWRLGLPVLFIVWLVGQRGNREGRFIQLQGVQCGHAL